MEEEAAAETTSLFTEETGKPPEVAITRRMRIENNDGEHSLHLVVVIEDIRAGYYIIMILIHILGIILTKAYTKGDYEAIIKGVYGVSNNCVYFDFPPATYVLPIMWCFAILFGVVYCVTAIIRIRIAYLENKLSQCEAVLLYIAYVYTGLSVIYFAEIFAVQPEPGKPVTMIVHSLPYVNLKVGFCILQVAVTYFGINVSWIGLKLPRWFRIASQVHSKFYIFTTLVGIILILNALGDMGEGMVGKGLWWSVRSNVHIVLGHIFANFFGFLLGTVLPLFQALFICWHGVNTHALVVAVSDNRVSACVKNR